MNILFVKLKEPKRETQKSVYMPPLGLWSMRTFLGDDHFVDICDEHMGADIADYLDKRRYNLIGISAQFSIQHKEYLRVAERAKQYGSRAKIIAGGFHASIAENKYVDEVVSGWGERYFKSDVKIDDIFFPWFLNEEMERYWKRGAPHDLQSKLYRWMSIETSRGCNRKCRFCGVRRFWGRWIGHSVGWVEMQLRFLRNRGIDEVFIEDDNVSFDYDRFVDILKLFEKLKMCWSCPNGIYIKSLEELIGNKQESLLRRSNCWRLSLPFETGTKKVAKLMKLDGKWIPFGRALALVKVLNDQGIRTCGFFMIGYPGETVEDMQRTLEYANKLPLGQRNIYIATPYPGTALYSLCKSKGYLTMDGEELYDNLLYTKGFIETPEWSPGYVEALKREDRDRAMRKKDGED